MDKGTTWCGTDQRSWASEQNIKAWNDTAWVRQYPLSKEADEGIFYTIQALIEQGIIYEGATPCNIPIYLIKKAKGGIFIPLMIYTRISSSTRPISHTNKHSYGCHLPAWRTLLVFYALLQKEDTKWTMTLQYAQKEVHYLGQIIFKDVRRVTPRRAESIEICPSPLLQIKCSNS